MAGYTPFTNNYRDLSDANGYQFEFVCDICGSGYRSEFERSALGSASTLISGASNVLGGLWGASNATRGAKDFMDRGARDEALKKAAEELMPMEDLGGLRGRAAGRANGLPSPAQPDKQI